MENSLPGLAKLAVSLLVFTAICLAIGSTAYHVFAPDGWLFMWGKNMWATHPLILILLGGICVLIKRWLDSRERSARIADFMVYFAVLTGVLFGINFLVAG